MTPRNFHPHNEKDPYVMDRGWKASVRLTAQHYVLQRRLGWLLHPRIKEYVSGQNNPVVCDFAAGNGIWALDLARDLANARIICTDISKDQFPVRKVSQNVTFEVYSFLDEPPDHLVGAFDVINIRYIIGALLKPGPASVIKNIHKMLKPGGWLQWHEFQPPCYRAVDFETLEMTQEGFGEVLDGLMGTGGLGSGQVWTFQLPQLLQQEGFKGAETYWPPLVADNVDAETEVAIWSMEELSMAVASRETDEEVAHEKMKWVSMLIEERSRGTRWVNNSMVVTCRKAR